MSAASEANGGSGYTALKYALQCHGRGSHADVCPQNVTAVLFLAAISGYDQGLIEDRDSVRMLVNMA